MKKQLTVRQWLETLPEPLRSAAIKQAKIERTINRKYESLSHAIWNGFTWKETKEGFDFWHGLTLNLRWAESNED